tara:strand:+ start:109 stop:366 length:258 start_codon:yes stop_codon:yes gene_type:complete
MTKVKSNKQRKKAVAQAVSTAKAASTTKKRARTAKGRYIADDPSTPNINEAYVQEPKENNYSLGDYLFAILILGAIIGFVYVSNI